MSTILRSRVDPNFSPDTMTSPVWRNILFEKNGASHVAHPTFPSESAARAAAEEALAVIREFVATDRFGVCTCHDGAEILASDISHVLQIPA